MVRCFTSLYIYFLHILKNVFRAFIFHFEAKVCDYNKSTGAAYHYYSNHRRQFDASDSLCISFQMTGHLVISQAVALYIYLYI